MDDTDAKQWLVSDLVEDVLAAIGAFAQAGAADGMFDERAAQPVALLALMPGRDVEHAEESDDADGRWMIARKVADDWVISTVDRDA